MPSTECISAATRLQLLSGSLEIFKFIHAADIHLDSSLKGLEQYEGAPVDQIRRAPREGLANLVDLAIDQAVEFVLIAGDLYDGNWKNFQTGMFFVKQAARLRGAQIPLFVIAGNHDAANKMTRSLPLPDNVTFFSSEAPQTSLLKDIDVAIHGQSFATPEVLVDLSLAYPAAIRGCLNIGLLHTSADGREGHDSYSPCSLDGLKLKGYDYWALGHIHKREILCQDPFIAFSGNIQGRHIRETGAKGCYLVTVHDNRRLEPVFHALDVMRWEVVPIDLSGAADTEQVLERIAQGVERVVGQATLLPLALRVELQGATAAHRELHAHVDHWVHQVRGLALDAGQGQLWIEKVKLRTTDPIHSHSARQFDEAAIGELTELFAEVRDNPALLATLGFDFSQVLKKLPPELKQLAGQSPRNRDWLAAVLDQAESLLLHRLQHKQHTSASLDEE